LKYLQIEKADFFGESFGGIVAMLIATRHPTLVRRVAIYGTALRNKAEVTRRNLWRLLRNLRPIIAVSSTNAKPTSGSHRIRHSGPSCSPNQARCRWRGRVSPPRR
jgi:pimeloyl-ACP methyl ester carboxylesterase